MKTIPPRDEQIVTAFVTRFATSAGVLRVRGRYDANDDKPMLTYRPPGSPYDVYVSPKDWHHTEESALADAANRIRRKVASLQKNLKAMELRLANIPVEDQTGGHP